VLTAGETGSFSVTAAPDPNGWSATLRLNVAQLKLRFPSAQEYDLRLRDTNGTILWTWSANKIFAQIEHVLDIKGGWTATVAVPFPPAIPEGPHVYTLEAWLTTAREDPQIGAVTVVEVPGTVAADARRARPRP
jgi:hypothetical protein